MSVEIPVEWLVLVANIAGLAVLAVVFNDRHVPPVSWGTAIMFAWGVPMLVLQIAVSR